MDSVYHSLDLLCRGRSAEADVPMSPIMARIALHEQLKSVNNIGEVDTEVDILNVKAIIEAIGAIDPSTLGPEDIDMLHQFRMNVTYDEVHEGKGKAKKHIADRHEVCIATYLLSCQIMDPDTRSSFRLDGDVTLNQLRKTCMHLIHQYTFNGRCISTEEMLSVTMHLGDFCVLKWTPEHLGYDVGLESRGLICRMGDPIEHERGGGEIQKKLRKDLEKQQKASTARMEEDGSHVPMDVLQKEAEEDGDLERAIKLGYNYQTVEMNKYSVDEQAAALLGERELGTGLADKLRPVEFDDIMLTTPIFFKYAMSLSDYIKSISETNSMSIIEDPINIGGVNRRTAIQYVSRLKADEWVDSLSLWVKRITVNYFMRRWYYLRFDTRNNSPAAALDFNTGDPTYNDFPTSREQALHDTDSRWFIWVNNYLMYYLIHQLPTPRELNINRSVFCFDVEMKKMQGAFREELATKYSMTLLGSTWAIVSSDYSITSLDTEDAFVALDSWMDIMAGEVVIDYDTGRLFLVDDLRRDLKLEVREHDF